MHLYLYARGKFEQVEMWKCHAQATYWKLRKFNNKTHKEEIILVQGALRPSVLGAYEYVFPKEALAEVCSFFGITKNQSYGFGTIGLCARHFTLRKIFGCRKIPNDILKKAAKIPPTFSTKEFERGGANCVISGTGIHVIGIKDDAQITIGDYTHEAL
ncbi:MAG: hypothetical protein AAB355_00285 [Patescibacteria group bacterium]